MKLDKLLLKVNKEEQKQKSKNKANLKKNMVERDRCN